ncbi:hypothetical protein OUZ56_032450 [Daphnia magna]|uniref:Uncharacterized protein n=1 Tax=Daphnia magna TaxID=35525 RepID=A0ABR0B8Y1_9CRUS|nr:hypothetical protein OUZ56_032450 [Daphnia magna]
MQRLFRIARRRNDEFVESAFVPPDRSRPFLVDEDRRFPAKEADERVTRDRDAGRLTEVPDKRLYFANRRPGSSDRPSRARGRLRRRRPHRDAALPVGGQTEELRRVRAPLCELIELCRRMNAVSAGDRLVHPGERVVNARKCRLRRGDARAAEEQRGGEKGEQAKRVPAHRRATVPELPRSVAGIFE